jgi:hypothetical protein
MKKKSLKSLNLNKKVISKLEADQVHGGILLTVTCLTCTCTFGEICQAVGEAVEEAADVVGAFAAGVVDGYNASANN